MWRNALEGLLNGTLERLNVVRARPVFRDKLHTVVYKQMFETISLELAVRLGPVGYDGGGRIRHEADHGQAIRGSLGCSKDGMPHD